MIPEARACSYQLHTTRPYLTNRTYRENAEALGLGQRPLHRKGGGISSKTASPEGPEKEAHDAEAKATANINGPGP